MLIVLLLEGGITKKKKSDPVCGDRPKIFERKKIEKRKKVEKLRCGNLVLKGPTASFWHDSSDVVCTD